MEFHGLSYEEYCSAVSTFEKDGNIFPKGIPNDVALNILFDHFIGPEFQINYPCGNEQANTEMVAYILKRYESGKLMWIPSFEKSPSFKVDLEWLKNSL